MWGKILFQNDLQLVLKFNFLLPRRSQTQYIAYICIDKQVHVLHCFTTDHFEVEWFWSFLSFFLFFCFFLSRIADQEILTCIYLSLSFSFSLVFSFSCLICTILPPSISLFLSLCPSSISPAGLARFRALSNCTCVSCSSKLVTRFKAARSGESNCIESQEYVERSYLVHADVSRTLERSQDVVIGIYVGMRACKICPKVTYFAEPRGIPFIVSCGTSARLIMRQCP